jgi:hypothetical protein
MIHSTWDYPKEGECADEETLPLEREGWQAETGGLGADYVAGLKAFGAFEQIELHGLTLVERAVAVLLNGGEVYENVFTRGALDETISLRPVEPLNSSLLSHRKTPFP